MNQSNLSAGVTLLRAADAGFDKTIFDRERARAMVQLLLLAIRMKMAFDLDDAPLLHGLGMANCVDSFQPLSPDYYLQACLSDSSYAVMWEHTHNIRPVIAAWAGSSTADNHTARCGGTTKASFGVSTHITPDMAYSTWPQKCSWGSINRPRG